jgi:hypothetical protein
MPVAGLFKHVFPALVHRPTIVQILLIKLVFEPTVDTRIWIWFHCHRRRRFLLLMIQ